MSGYGHTRHFALPYPYTRNQVVRVSDVANLANAIDDALKSVADEAVIASTQPTAEISLDSATQSVTGGTTIVLQYNQVYWDTGGMVNLAVANDRIVCGSGRWRFTGEVTFAGGSFDPSSVRLSILANSGVLVRKKKSGYNGASYGISIATSAAFTSTGNFIQLSFIATGSGTGAANGRLTAQRLGDAFPFTF